MKDHIGRHSGILNSEKNIEMLRDYNEISVYIAMLNAKNEAKAKLEEKKKAEEKK